MRSQEQTGLVQDDSATLRTLEIGLLNRLIKMGGRLYVTRLLGNNGRLKTDALRRLIKMELVGIDDKYNIIFISQTKDVNMLGFHLLTDKGWYGRLNDLPILTEKIEPEVSFYNLDFAEALYEARTVWLNCDISCVKIMKGSKLFAEVIFHDKG